ENVSISDLKLAVKNVKLKYPELALYDKSIYKEGKEILNDGDYYCTIEENGNLYLFQFSYPSYPPPNDSIAQIALTSAALYKDDLKLANNIGFFEKIKYRRIFENYFITKIKKELEDQRSEPNSPH